MLTLPHANRYYPNASEMGFEADLSNQPNREGVITYQENERFESELQLVQSLRPYWKDEETFNNRVAEVKKEQKQLQPSKVTFLRKIALGVDKGIERMNSHIYSEVERAFIVNSLIQAYITENNLEKAEMIFSDYKENLYESQV